MADSVAAVMTYKRNEYKKNMARLKETRKLAQKTYTMLKKSGLVVNMDCFGGAFFIGVVGTGDDLGLMFGLLRRAGFVPMSRPKEKESYYSSGWNHPDDKNAGPYKPTFDVAFSSTTCKRVAVGTTMVEQTVYETVCE